MPQAGFELTIPATSNEQPYTHALDRAATGMAFISFTRPTIKYLLLAIAMLLSQFTEDTFHI